MFLMLQSRQHRYKQLLF